MAGSAGGSSAAHPLQGVALFLAAMLLFACLDATSKHLSQKFAVPMLVWARYTVHFLLMVVFLAPTMGMRLLRTRRPLPQIVRALMLMFTTAFGIAALKLMPLAETTAMVFVSPLLVTILAVFMLHEKVRPSRWIAVTVGLAGMVLIARPGSGLVPIGVAYALIAASLYSLYQILTRQLVATEHPITMVFYTALVGTVVTTWGLPWYWGGPLPDPMEVLLICSLGIYGGVGHFLLTRAFRLAPASLLSPFLYVQLVWSTLLGWIVFDHFPDAVALAGILIIVASGLFIALTSRAASTRGERC